MVPVLYLRGGYTLAQNEWSLYKELSCLVPSEHSLFIAGCCTECSISEMLLLSWGLSSFICGQGTLGTPVHPPDLYD